MATKNTKRHEKVEKVEVRNRVPLPAPFPLLPFCAFLCFLWLLPSSPPASVAQQPEAPWFRDATAEYGPIGGGCQNHLTLHFGLGEVAGPVAVPVPWAGGGT